MTDGEREAFELWKALTPSEAYLLGVDDLGGTLFIPTRDNIIIRRRELDNIWRSTLDISIRSLLRWARCYLDLLEPHKPPQDIMWATATHLMKEGPRNPLLPSLMNASIMYMDHSISNLKLHRWPLESQVMVLQTTDALRSMLSAIPANETGLELNRSLLDKVAEYEELFPINESLGPSHKDLVSVLEEGEGHMGRGDIYPRILTEIYACSDRHKMIEEKLLLELYRELPELKRTSFELKDIYGTTPDIQEIEKALAKDRAVKMDEMIPTLEGLRDRLSFWAIRRLIDYPHEKDMGVKETPTYFEQFIGTGKCMNMNGLTGSPVSDLYISFDQGMDRPISYADIFMLLVHEELGHRAHYLNSYTRPREDVGRNDLMIGLMMASTREGFANNRELEVLGLLKDMDNRKEELLPDERRLVDYIKTTQPLDELITEIEFLVSRNRVLGLLGGVADVRMNSGKQSIIDFIRWAHIITGIEESYLFNVVMDPGITPGFQASQQMITMDLREISQVLRNEGMSLKEFNTMSTQLGFPPWRFLKERIINL